MARLEIEIEIVRHSPKRELALALLDACDLNFIDDGRQSAAGHIAPQAMVADLMRHARRSHDVLFRYGDDELVCAWPFANLQVATDLLLQTWQRLNEGGPSSFTAGFAELRDGDDAATLVDRAEDCLYAGRRRPHPMAWRIAL
jgi:GGDEF domain-containing protein